MDFSERMANKLKEARKQAHVNATDAGRAVNRSDKTIYAWENCKSEPSAEQLITLCHLYGVDIAYFYDNADSDTSPSSQDELELLRLYRFMQPDAKRVLLDVARIFLNR
jgi:DNA-binding XRE family transcriptional regulator